MSENKNYPKGSKVPALKSLDFTPDDLAHALFTTGRAPGDQAKYGHASFFEAVHRCAVIPAYVRRNKAGALMRSRLATELDRSEKGALSYALGQAMTTIFCRQVLGTTHLLHIDRYRFQEHVKFKKGTKTRADLFGPSPSGWVVAEAKGRTNNSDAALVSKLKSQKRSVKTIHGAKPWIATGCVACFPQPSHPAMRAFTWDPEEAQEDAINIDGTMDDYFRAYYGPIMSALALGADVNVEGPDFVTTRIAGLNMTLGLRSNLYQALQAQGVSARDSTEVYDNTLVARLALGDLYGAFTTTFDANSDPKTDLAVTQTTQAESPSRASQELREEQRSSPDANTPGTVFPDGTVFGTDWDDAISFDDVEDQF